jgi:UDP-N-acetyl-D-glucosamine dehydrogenase
MPRWVVAKIAEALNEDAKPVKGSRILVLGLAYKANIDDDRESPSYEIIEHLQESGARVDYCDPFFPVTPVTRKRELGMTSVAVDAALWRGYDALVVSTAHEVFKQRALFEGLQLVVDTRNLVAGLFPGGGGPKRVVKA